VRSLGAAHTVDYTGDIPAAVRAIAAQGVDKVLHAAGDAAALGSTLKAGGTLASTRGASTDEVGREDVTVAAVMAAATADKLATLLDHAAKGDIRVNVETTVPLERAPEAFAAFADGTLGKVLITR
jgi:NADPH:quinone reductase